MIEKLAGLVLGIVVIFGTVWMIEKLADLVAGIVVIFGTVWIVWGSAKMWKQ